MTGLHRAPRKYICDVVNNILSFGFNMPTVISGAMEK